MGKRSVNKEAEEEQYRDLLLLMELLTNLLSKVRQFYSKGSLHLKQAPLVLWLRKNSPLALYLL